MQNPRGWTRIYWPTLMALVALAGDPRTQEAEGRAESQKSLQVAGGPTVTVGNPTNLPRLEWTSCTVPFPQGTVAGIPDLVAVAPAGTVDTASTEPQPLPTAWQPLGARWPDGSLRFGTCMVKVPLRAGQQMPLRLVPGTPLPQARPEEGLPEGFQPVPPIDPQSLNLTFELRNGEGEGVVRADAAPAQVLEAGVVRRVERWTCRVGAPALVCEVFLTRYLGQPHLHVSVGTFFSDPNTPAIHRGIPDLTVSADGMQLWLRHGPRFGLRHVLTENGSRVGLLRATHLGDGQGIRRAGVLVPLPPENTSAVQGAARMQLFTDRAAIEAPLLAAADWRGSDGFGPFGVVPPLPPWLQGGNAGSALASRHQRFRKANPAGDPFQTPRWGLSRSAGQTGDQQDFGVIAGLPVVTTGLPTFLLEWEASVLQEACRPVHNFDSYGDPIRAADHPDWIVWSGRTHWHCEVSKDRLGKPCPQPELNAHGWTGKDRQHWSSNNLCAFALLTGAPWAMAECRTEVQLYLSGQTIDKRHTTSGPGAPRGAGRALLTASWLYLATGDEALRARMNARLDGVHWPHFAGIHSIRGDGTGPELDGGRPDRALTFGYSGPDARILDGKTSYWTPWQDALAAVGFAAAHRVTGNPRARTIARELSLNVLRHGWKAEGRDIWIATAIRWNPSGDPVPMAELLRGGKNTVVWSHGTGFNLWAGPAVVLARGFAEAEGDTAMVAKAEHILRALAASRTAPRDGWFDRYMDWMAITPL